MKDWKSLLSRDRTTWLLEPSSPSVRYWTQRWILGLQPGDPALAVTRAAIASSEPVRRLVASQKPGGYWGANPLPHNGARLGVQLLAWLGCDRDMTGTEGRAAYEAAVRAMDCMTSGHLDADGAYRYVTPSSGRVVLLPCHGAELARSLFRFGKAKDGRLATMVDWLLSLENADGSFPCLAKEARPSCLFVTALILRLAEDLRALPDSGALGAGRRRAMEGAAATSATLVLDGGFARAARNKPQGRWFAFGLPLLWDSDVLELLRLVAPFTTANDPRLRPALDLVLSKQAKDGTWPCEKKPKSDTWISKYVELDTPGKASKWVTLAAYRALKAVYEES